MSMIALPVFAQDWNGAYGGASFGLHNGTNTDYFEGEVFDGGYDNPYTREGTMTGLFAGYRWQQGNLVFGPELSYSVGSLEMEPFPDNEVNQTQAITFRAGYAVDKALVSVGIGYFQSNLDPACVDVCGSAQLEGPSVGIGIDYVVTDSLFIGANVTYRTFGKATYEILSPDWEVDGDDTAIEIRIGYNF